VITSDQGGEFNNDLDSELMGLMGIDHRLTTPYHPQVNTVTVILICAWTSIRKVCDYFII